MENLTSYLGSVWMRPSLEVDDTIGVSRARFCVFFHWPFLSRWSRQAGVFTQLHIRVFWGQAGCEANMLPDQASTAAPGAGNRFAFNSYLLLITETKIQGWRGGSQLLQQRYHVWLLHMLHNAYSSRADTIRYWLYKSTGNRTQLERIQLNKVYSD